MKKQFTIIAWLIFVALTCPVFVGSEIEAFAQEKENDTLKIKWKGSKIWIFDDKDVAKKDSAKKDKKDFAHWGGMDIGINMLTTVDNQLKLSDENDPTQMNTFLGLNYGKSWYFSLNLLEKKIRLYKNHAILITGLGFEWNNYNFKKPITLSPDAEYISASNTTTAPEGVTFSKNKLKAAYVKAPLLLEINTNSKDSDKSFHIAGGIEFAYKIGSKTKQAYEINGYEYEAKRKGEYHLADIKYCSTVRVGYGDYFTLFANYGLSQLFEKNKGPGVYPFTAGLSITF